jgi:Carboxypeptidase regulatory-like domain/TonB dependent receptor
MLEQSARRSEDGMTTRLLVLHRGFAVALLFTGVAAAQTTGTLIGVVTDAQTGRPLVGALVVATSPLLQGPQTGLTDTAGAFHINLLPPGEYRLAATLDGYLAAERADIQLRLDMTLRANLVLVPEVVRMEEQVVKSSQARPVVDVGSAETGTIISRDFLDDIPVGRGFEDVALVAPTARLTGYGVAFAGSTAPENSYLLDGMSVNFIVVGTLGLELRSNFVQEIEVKTGNFMPEYGYSTGGVLNVVTKSGSNEFHGSVFGTWNPGLLRPDPKPVGRDAEALSLQTIQADSYQADLGFEVGGPVMKDRLWFYAGFSPGIDKTRVRRVVTAIQEDPASDPLHPQPLRDAYGHSVGAEQPTYGRVFDNRSTEYQLTSKLTYLFNEDNTLAVSFTTIPSSSEGLGGANADPASAQFRETRSTTQAVARYSSKLLEKRLTVELVGGWYRVRVQTEPKVVEGLDQANVPAMSWNWTEPLASFQSVPAACQATSSGFEPCAVSGYKTGGYGDILSSTNDRFTAKASVTWLANLLGSHLLKAGAQFDRSTSQYLEKLSGGQVLQARAASAPNPAYRSPATNPDQAANPWVSASDYLPGAGYPSSYGVWYRSTQLGFVTGPNQASTLGTGASLVDQFDATTESNILGLYLQDSWSPIDGLTVNAGLRWEAQDMGLQGQPVAISINDSFGPRVQAIYDWTRQGRSKVAVSWGRFYEAIPLSLGDAFRNSGAVRSFRAYCYDPRADPTHAQLRTGPDSCDIRQGFYDTNGSFTPGTSYTYSKVPGGWSGILPVAPDLKGQYVDMFIGTVEYELFPDFSVGLEYQGRRLGRAIEDMSSDDGYNFFIANPGTGAPFYNPNTGDLVDPKVAAGMIDPVTGRAYSAPFPKARRDYDAVTFSIRKNFSNRWQLQASYTWSSLRGNYGGLVEGVNEGELLPNHASSFDLPSLLANSTGPLPGDSTHQLKAYGSYTFDLGPRFSVTTGAGVRGWSGTPLNYMGAHPDYGAGSAFILPRGSAGRTPFLTQVDLGTRLQYVLSPPYAIRLSVDAFNLLNAQQATRFDQSWTFDPVEPIIGGQCRSHNGASGADPIGKALADCPDLAYLRTLDGRPVTINHNFGRATAYQQPLAIRLGLELTF